MIGFCRKRILISLKLVTAEAVARRCSVKKVFLQISQNLQENTFARVSFLIKLQTSACNFIKKETLVQVFYCEFYKISQNNFSHRTPPVAASVTAYLYAIYDKPTYWYSMMLKNYLATTALNDKYTCKALNEQFKQIIKEGSSNISYNRMRSHNCFICDSSVSIQNVDLNFHEISHANLPYREKRL